MEAYDDVFQTGGAVGYNTVVPTRGCCMVLDFSSLAMQSLTGLASAKMSSSLGYKLKPDQIYMYENENNFITWSDGFFDRLVSMIHVLGPSSMIIATDCDGSNWRKNIYPDYKFGRRSKQKTLACVDWDIFKEAKRRAIQFFRDIGLLVIGTDRAEADDVIYCVARTAPNVVVASTDGDMLQLAKWGTKVYNPVKMQFTEELDPNYFLELKVMVGDSSDFIHSIRGTLTDKKAIWPTSIIKKSGDIGVLNYLLEHEEENPEVTVPLPSGAANMKMSDIYIRNKKLIDMEYIPKDITDSIMAAWGASANSMKYDYEAACNYNKKYADIIGRLIRMA